MACEAPRGVPEPQIWWERNGVRLPTTGRVHQEAEELVFTSIAEKDAGVYTCHAVNKAGEKKQELSITVASKQVSVFSGRGMFCVFAQRWNEVPGWNVVTEKGRNRLHFRNLNSCNVN